MRELKNYQKDFDLIEEGKFTYLGRSKEKINNLVVQCNKCKQVFELSFSMMKKNGFKCPKCEIVHKTQKKTFVEYWEEFVATRLDKKYEINAEEYTSSNGKIHAKCRKCGAIRYSRARSLIAYPNCKNCVRINKAYSEEYTKQQLQEKYNGEIELIEFHGWTQIGTVKCNRCGKFFKKIIGPLLTHKNETGCKYCRLTNQVRALHPSWTGGTQNISDYFRSAVYRTWRVDSLSFYGEKCLISGEKENIVVHHLNKSFLELEEQVFEEFGYSKMTIVENIKEKDLVEMRRRIQQLHYLNGYGVPITDCLHKEFHSKYGKINNTPEQFIEFAKSKGVNLKIENGLLVQSNY